MSGGLPEELPQPRILSGVGKGWWPLVRTLHDYIYHLDPNYKLDQVKEKFGLLRYYVTTQVKDDKATAQIHTLTFFAETLSGTICEECGAPGRQCHPLGGWIHTLCEKCEKELIQNQQKEAKEWDKLRKSKDT